MTKYRVGQVLYIIPKDTATLVPVQIKERRISETESGVVVKHLLKSHKPKSQPIILESVPGRVFEDLRSARDAMIKNATTAIDAMIKRTQEIAQRTFTSQVEAIDESIDPFEQHQDLEADAAVVSVPTEQPRTLPLEHIADLDVDGMTEIMLPNGRKQRVKVNLNS